MYLALALIAVVAALLVWGWERARGRWVAPMLEEVLKSRELVLVTGGSRGLGLEFAHAFAERNFDVVLVARSAEQLEKAKEEVAARHGVEVFALTCDLAASGGAERLARAVEEAGLGERIGVLVNNAGIGYAGPVHTQGTDRLEALVNLNCTAPLILCRLFLERMVSRRRGLVINVSSVSAYQPLPTHAAYAASKAFTSTMSFSIMEEVRRYGVHVMAVEPGTVETGFASAAGQAPHHGATAKDVVRDAMKALDWGLTSSVHGWYVWARANGAAILPRSLVAPIARRKMEPLDMNNKGA